MRHGLSDDDIAAATSFDPWFLARIREIVDDRGAHPPQDGLPMSEDAHPRASR
jgi:carbamoyl-phosphate synthase large subunit